MFNLGTQEIILIVVLALVFLGPKKLPDLASGLGKAIREVRKATADIRNEIELDDAIRKPLEELREATMLHPEELKRRDREKAEQARRLREEAEEAARIAADPSAAPTLDHTTAVAPVDPQSHEPVAELTPDTTDLPPPQSFIGTAATVAAAPPIPPSAAKPGPRLPPPSDKTMMMDRPPAMDATVASAPVTTPATAVASGPTTSPGVPAAPSTVPATPAVPGRSTLFGSPPPALPTSVADKASGAARASAPPPLPTAAPVAAADRPSGAVVSGTIKVPAAGEKPPLPPRKPLNTVPRGTIIGMPAPNLATSIPGASPKLPPPAAARPAPPAETAESKTDNTTDDKKA